MQMIAKMPRASPIQLWPIDVATEMKKTLNAPELTAIAEAKDVSATRLEISDSRAFPFRELISPLGYSRAHNRRAWIEVATATATAMTGDPTVASIRESA
jgi:hypothetical protein